MTPSKHNIHSHLLSFAYLVGSGAEISIVKYSVVNLLDGVIKPECSMRVFTGPGSKVVHTIGACEFIVVLPAVTLEINFMIISDGAILRETDMILDWDVISRPCL